MKIYNFSILIEPSEDGGYFVECPAMQGCYTSGKTLNEAISNIKEAILAHIEERITCGEAIPVDEKILKPTEALISVEV